MKALEQLERIKRMTELIQAERTGTPSEFAGLLHISESHLYRTLEELKILGMPIGYSKIKKTYFFEKEIEVILDYSIKIIDGHKMRKISGGLEIKIPDYFFLRVSEPTFSYGNLRKNPKNFFY
jgi:hypothetical protein